MKIGILGSGVVGQQLSEGFHRLGHEVIIGTRDPQKLGPWLETGGKGCSVGTFEAAAKFGELIVLATKWEGTKNAIELAGEANFAGKVLIDATNPLDTSGGGHPRFIATPGNSGGEQVQSWLPEAKVVKAFNTISAYIMCSPVRQDGVPDLFICGNDAAAKELVGIFASQWEWHSVVDLGGIEEAFFVEALAHIWITYGFKNNNWTHAFKLLRK